MKRISSGSAFELKIGYSRAVVDDRYVHISGTTGYNYATMSIDPDPVIQAEQCCQNIATVLHTAGSDFEHVVRVRYLFTDRADFEACWPVLNRYFGEFPPTATMMIVGLYDPAMKLEIEVIARLSS